MATIVSGCEADNAVGALTYHDGNGDLKQVIFFDDSNALTKVLLSLATYPYDVLGNGDVAFYPTDPDHYCTITVQYDVRAVSESIDWARAVW